MAVRSFPRRYRALLVTPGSDDRPDAVFRRRPDPGTWSALEYTAHVADVLDDLATAVRRMTTERQPTITDGFDPDQRAIDARYNEQDRGAVLANLKAAAERAAGVIDGVDASSWRDTATFSFGERDALTMARNAVHEGYHHLRDIESVLRQVRGRET